MVFLTCSVTVRAYEGAYRYMIYEVWQDSESLQRSVTEMVSLHFCVHIVIVTEMY